MRYISKLIPSRGGLNLPYFFVKSVIHNRRGGLNLPYGCG